MPSFGVILEIRFFGVVDVYIISSFDGNMWKYGKQKYIFLKFTLDGFYCFSNKHNGDNSKIHWQTNCRFSAYLI